ncbi:DUF5060 domain-containing protein [Arachidicoccus sp.]|uniref:DUF5060 domain-containing protein n=1 Tax=Arachidicoccus sp. TaxID=1872624 RepID=UPI003D23C62C
MINTFGKKGICWICMFFPLFCFSQQKIEQWGRFETSFNYHYNGDAFTDVDITATFINGDSSITVDGFYDGNNVFRVRFMPSKIGTWTYTTHSNIRALNAKRGSFDCVKASGDNHGMVRVSNTYYFKYADGKQFYPVGTTAYAWNHMSKGMQQMTLKSLKASGFDKLRMCVFPKNYDLVKEEPEIFPFNVLNVDSATETGQHKKWDFSTFNPLFFQTLEKQIDALNSLGIQADLILFHPYDHGRWGFDALPMTVNIRYLKYIIARLGSFRNVWWSMANEWDLVKAKTHSDWIKLSKYVYDNDPYHHLCSIHGTTGTYFEYWLPYFSHASIQDEAPVMNWGAASILRDAYHKPVIYDEVGYEGNLKNRWGRYSGEEMTYLMWMGAIGGTYVTHGEAYKYYNGNDTIFWAKGGMFRGTSWKRAAFLRKILEADPAPLEPADISHDFKTAAAGDGDYIIYFGKEMPENWVFNIPAKNGSYPKPVAGDKYKIDIIDTWAMTITPVKDVFEIGKEVDYRFYGKNRKKIWLPLKPYLALRVTKIN